MPSSHRANRGNATDHCRWRQREQTPTGGARGKAPGEVVYAPLDLCTDNGAMIAYAGALRLRSGARETLGIHTRPRWPMTELTPI